MAPILSIITAVRDQIACNTLFLHSLNKYTFHPHELIVVDNGSSDGSPDFFQANGATVIRNRENRCYACSQNLGLAKASGTYVAFLNNDIYLSNEWDRVLIGYLEEYGLDVISPCGTETMESPRRISQSLRKWKLVSAFQRLRRALGRDASEERLIGLVCRMYGDWDDFTMKRAERFKRFLYPGISGFALIARRSLFSDLGPWTKDVSASDFDLRLRLVKDHVERGRFSQPMIAGDVFVHHFIRTTTRSVKDPYHCNHSFTPFKEYYNAVDRRYASIPLMSVIIAVYNKPDFLEKVLISLRNQTQQDFEVVIADDGSGPEIESVVEKYRPVFPFGIQHVRHDDWGFRKTIIVNKAVVRARSDYLVFIDGDSLLHHRFLAEHLRCRREGAILSGRRVMLERELTSKMTIEEIVSRRFEKITFWMGRCEKNSRKHGLYLPIANSIEALLHGRRQYDILGANFSLYRGDYYRINGYDERIIGRGLEDDNLGNRFKIAGCRIRSMSRRAIQYHLYHSFDPVPHSAQRIREMGSPDHAWSDYGLIKTDKNNNEGKPG